MSATASVSNPAAAAAPGAASAKPAKAGPAAAFDAMMAAFFASLGDTATPGAPAAAAATANPLAGAAVVESGKTAPDKDGALLDGATDGEGVDGALTGAAAGAPDASLAMALLGLGATTVPSQAAAQTKVGGDAAGGGSTGGGAAGGAAQAGQIPPTLTLPEAADAAALLQAQTGAATEAAAEHPAGVEVPAQPAATATTFKPLAGEVSAPETKSAKPAANASAVAKAATAAAPAAANVAETPAAPAAEAPAAVAATAAVDASATQAAQAEAPALAAQAKPAEKTAEKPARAARIDATSAAAPRVGGASAPAAAAAALASPQAGDKAVAQDASAELAAPTTEAEAAPQDVDGGGQASPQAALQTREAAAAHAPAPTPVRGSPETVANLSAHIIKKLDQRSSRFDVQLDPIGLGHVNVRLEIDAHGQVSAAMSFDNPQAAAELKSRASELQRALEQAGFDVSGGMSFDVAGDSGRGAQQQQREFGSDTGAAFRGRAFQAALDTAGEAASAAAASALYYRQAPATGVDVRI